MNKQIDTENNSKNYTGRIKLRLDCICGFAFLLGFTSTMPIIGIALGSRDISFFRLLFLLTIGYCGICTVKSGIRIGYGTKLLLLWLAIGVIACFCGAIFLFSSAPEWSEVSSAYISKVLSLMFFALVWCSQPNVETNNKYVAKGFILGCVMNCIWASVDAAGFYLLHGSIHNKVFQAYALRHEIRYGMMSITEGGLIRSAGFNSDPAHIGFIAPIIVCYSIVRKKYWLFLLGVAAVLASASTTALVTSMMVIVVNVYWNTKKRLNIKGAIVVCICVMLAIIITLVYQNSFSNVLISAYSHFSARINSVYLNPSRRNIRLEYVMFVFRAMGHVFPYILLGSGFGTASLGYVRDPYVINLFGDDYYFPYDMENTYIAYFFDTGIVGIIIFIIMLKYLTVSYWYSARRKKDDFYITIWCVICSSLFTLSLYHYILFGPQMLMFTVALSQVDKERMLS